ncbi:hypothetical protein D3C86_1561060 [compost metagenome]
MDRMVDQYLEGQRHHLSAKEHLADVECDAYPVFKPCFEQVNVRFDKTKLRIERGQNIFFVGPIHTQLVTVHLRHFIDEFFGGCGSIRNQH